MDRLIKGYGDRYIAKETGEIIDTKYDRPVCQWVDNVGYKQCILFDHGKRCYKRVHRVIAETLIPNPEKLSQVNHKDGVKTNNKIENLEWTNNQKNTQHGYDTGAYKFHERSHAVDVYSRNDEFVVRFKSIRQAAEVLGLNRKTITAILKKEKENHYSYKFKYANESVETIESNDQEKSLGS